MSQGFNETWDEFQWEEHLHHIEQKSSQLRQRIKGMRSEKEGLPSWYSILTNTESVEEALDEYLDDELSYEEAYFPDDTDEDLEDDDEVDEDIFLDVGNVNFSFEAIRDTDELNQFIRSERRKDNENDLERFFFEEEEDDDSEDFEDLFDDMESLLRTNEDSICYHLFDESCELAEYFLYRTKMSPELLRHDAYESLASNMLKISSRFAAACNFDQYSVQYTGAIIAYAKRSLDLANESLILVRNLLIDELIDKREFHPLTKRIFELRNETALLIQDLRDFLKPHL